MSGKLTVSKLRDELEKRGLDSTGLKPALVSRLDDAIAEEAAEASKKGNNLKDDEKQDGKKRPSRALPDKEETKDAKRVKVEDVSELTVTELKEALSSRGLSISGKKHELAERLTETVEAEAKVASEDGKMVVDKNSGGDQVKVEDVSNMSVKEIKEELSARLLSVKGAKAELVQRLTDALEADKNAIKEEDISGMSLKELREALTTRCLSAIGKKSELVERLTEAVKAKDAPANKDATVVVVKKGRAVLDQYIDDKIKANHHVYEGKMNGKMEVFDAMLNQTNLGDNNNKFYVLQLLEADSGKNYYVFNRWGRVGVKGQQKLFGPWPDALPAIGEFKLKFYDKTRNHWEERHNFQTHANKYTWIEMDYEDDSDKKSAEDDKQGKSASKKSETDKSETKKPDPNKPSKLNPRLKEFIELICNVNMMKQMMMEIGYDARKMPLGKLSKSTILKGYEVLKRLAAALDDKSSSARRSIQELTSEFYTVIPHDFGFKHMQNFIIDTPQKLKHKLEMVEALGEIEVATKLLSNDNDEDDDPAYTHYKRLNCEMEPLDTTSDEYALVKQYMEKTHGQTHYGYKLELLNVFKLQREGENDRFQNFEKDPNRMLLWHGSRLSNWTGILSQGLRIAPPEAPVTGYMFGKGVYFADMVSKSANYCCTHANDPIGVLLLSEVALGGMNELLRSDYHANKLPAGKLSTKGVGRTFPDPKEYKTLENGVVVPVGQPISSPLSMV
uniref:Poly [ADP-ribose] polymerase n=2 Tax=Physcomitrium patens TaxID=3218 RepID=A0A7I4FF06_PHYPA